MVFLHCSYLSFIQASLRTREAVYLRKSKLFCPEWQVVSRVGKVVID